MKTVAGFTLPELLTIFAVAVPNFNKMLRRRQLNGEANRLFTTIYPGRSESIKRNSTVTLCKSSDQATCSGNWSDGWIVFSDRNANRSVDGDDGIFSSVDGLGGGYTLKWNAFGSPDQNRPSLSVRRGRAFISPRT